MALPDIEDAFEIEGSGLLISSSTGRLIWIGSGSDDPTTGAGIEAPVGSSYHRTNGEEYRKFDTGDTDWTDSLANVFSGITPPFILNHNGSLSNGQLVGYTNLVNNPIVLGFKSKLVKVSYINTRSGSDAGFRFYRGLEQPANLFHTMSFTNVSSKVETIPGSPIFEVGDLLRIYFDDTGLNPRDMNMVVFFEAVP